MCIRDRGPVVGNGGGLVKALHVDLDADLLHVILEALGDLGGGAGGVGDEGQLRVGDAGLFDQLLGGVGIIGVGVAVLEVGVGLVQCGLGGSGQNLSLIHIFIRLAQMVTASRRSIFSCISSSF